MNPPGVPSYILDLARPEADRWAEVISREIDGARRAASVARANARAGARPRAAKPPPVNSMVGIPRLLVRSVTQLCDPPVSGGQGR